MRENGLTSNENLWDAKLTTKLVSLMKIKPIFDIKDLIIHDERLKDHYRHYDPLAITLKILELIIDHMGFSSTDPYTGITKQDLFEEIIPLLRRMDSARNITHLTLSDHHNFLEVILAKLLYLTREGMRTTYTDYSVNPPVERELPFRLISHRNFDGENIVLVAEPVVINFFLQMLDIELEDQQQALLHILSRQIKKGDITNAIKMGKSNILLTRQYMLKVEEIINLTRRNLSTIDWLRECPEELHRATTHIQECINTQTRQHITITQRLTFIPEDKAKERHLLFELKEILRRSLDLLLTLQKKVNEARETFLDEQWLQSLFTRKCEDRLQLESMVFDSILLWSYQEFIPFFEEVLVFFSHCKAPAVFVYDQLLSVTLKWIKFPDFYDLEKYEVERDIKPLELNQYSSILRREVVNFLLEHLQTNGNAVTLQELLEKAESLDKDFFFCNYLRLIIQGRYAKDNFEGHLIEFPLNVQYYGRSLNTTWFTGDNYLIALED